MGVGKGVGQLSRVQRQGYVCLNSPSLLSFYFPVVDLANNCREVQGAAI